MNRRKVGQEARLEQIHMKNAVVNALVSATVSLAVTVLVIKFHETPAPTLRQVAFQDTSPRALRPAPTEQGLRRDALDAVHREVSAAIAAVEATAPTDLETWSSNWVVDVASLSASGSWGVRSRSRPVEARFDAAVETTEKEVVLRAGDRELARVAFTRVGNGQLHEAVRDHLLAALKGNR